MRSWRASPHETLATIVWEFDQYNWPFVTFGLDGHRDNLLRKSSSGDAIVFVGTLGEPTPEKDQGRFLAITQFGHDPVDTLEALIWKIQPKGSFTRIQN